MNESSAEERQQRLDLLGNRGAIYAFLARVYQKEVTVDFLKEYSAKDSPLLLMTGIEEMGNEKLKEGFQEIIGYFRGLSGRDMTQVKLELDVEYAALFLGAKGRPLHPSESVYSTSLHLMMQKQRDEVMATYIKAGVDKAKEFTEPEDHIAVELQFMAYLCQKVGDALGKKDEAEAQKYLAIQQEFFDKHLSVWVPKLTKDIIESSKVDFYRGVAKITDGFIEMEKSEMGLLVKDTEREN